MIKIGFRSFIYGLVEEKMGNMYSNWKEQEKNKITKEQAEKERHQLKSFGKVSSAVALVSEPFTRGMQIGRAKSQSDIDFWINKTFSPITNELRFFGNRIASEWGQFFYENRLGATVGTTIGMGLGFIAGYFLPGGPALWSTLFGSVGNFTGAVTQEAITNPQGTTPYYNMSDNTFGNFSLQPPDKKEEIEEIIYDRSGVMTRREEIIKYGKEFAIIFGHDI